MYCRCFPLRQGLEEIREDESQPPQELKRQNATLPSDPDSADWADFCTNISDNEQNLSIFLNVTLQWLILCVMLGQTLF